MNYVLFFPDELRAKTLSCYGHPTIRTPSFDRLSLEGVTFESCYVQNPVCSPSRCCLFTGTYVHTLGHRTLWNLLKPYEHNMLETFGRGGRKQHPCICKPERSPGRTGGEYCRIRTEGVL